MIAILKALLRRSPSPAPSETPAAPPVDWRARGNAALGSGDLAEAARCYEQGLQQSPGDAVLRLNLGFVRYEQGRLPEAAALLEQSLAARRAGEDIAHDAHFLLARIRLQMGQPDAALASFQAAARSKADFAEPVEEIIPLLHRLGRGEETAGWMRERTSRAEAAIAGFDAQLQRDPADKAALLGKIAVLQQQQRPRELVATARAGLQVLPDDADLHWHLAFAQFLQGDYQEGWREHEWRLRHPGMQGKITQVPRPLWRGESLAGKTLFLHAEQGFGDVLQFLRFVPLAARQAQRVFLFVYAPLRPLVALNLPAHCELVEDAPPLEAIDFHAPLMSLGPVFCPRGADDIPQDVPYLRADPASVQAWRQRLGGEGLKVGIAWAGNAAQANDRNRSVPFDVFHRLAGVPGCRFFTVQPDLPEFARAQLATWPEAQDTGRELKDFAQTAALMEALDLVITVDTSVAHLAGALGRPLWVLLSHLPDWRWMLERADSPWYPTARLFRQPAVGDWPSAVAQVRSALAHFPTKKDD